MTTVLCTVLSHDLFPNDSFQKLHTLLQPEGEQVRRPEMVRANRVRFSTIGSPDGDDDEFAQISAEHGDVLL